MAIKTTSSFEYVLRGCNNSVNFAFLAEEYSSKTYTLQVFPLPQLLNFSLSAVVPSYTQLDNMNVTNTGDITIPAGTKISWTVDAADTDSLFFKIENGECIPFNKKDFQFTLNQNITHTTPYSLIGKNEYLDSIQIISYTFTVIPDLRPSIQVEQKQDSSQFFTYYFKGEIQDDYGFSSLDFVYFLNNNETKSTRVPMEFSTALAHQRFLPYLKDLVRYDFPFQFQDLV